MRLPIACPRKHIHRHLRRHMPRAWPLAVSGVCLTVVGFNPLGLEASTTGAHAQRERGKRKGGGLVLTGVYASWPRLGTESEPASTGVSASPETPAAAMRCILGAAFFLRRCRIQSNRR